MSLPPGFLDELRARTSIAQIAGRKVTWDQRKSNPGKGDYWAPCPFHTEKTASFHVDDQKGFYYCFGCHAKGDALSFVRETENMGFMDAVRLLADAAGMQMPAMDPAAAAKAEVRKGLAEVMEQAVQFYRLQLKTGAATEARDYLERRGLTSETLERFEIGFAPGGRQALFAYLTGKGITAEDLDRAGLCARPDDGGQPYDRFRDRIMFPIRDARGRTIAFGGRAMDPNARAKYLNSPETELFDKGRSLYNHGPAREAAGKAGSLIVAEGYMDVIALAQAGFNHAVAPLGTAITEDQLQLIWRITPEPVIALDGDKAGLRAALRLVDLALPHLEPEKSLRFCLLPEGLDPDDLIRAQGARAMADLLDSSAPMVDMLWRRETEGRSFDSPERRAALDTALRAALGKINHSGLRSHYETAIREKRAELFRPTRRDTSQRDSRGWRNTRPQTPLPTTRASLLGQATAGEEAAARVRESTILMGCLAHPDLAEELEADLDALPFLCPDLDQIRRALLQALSGDLSDLQTGTADILGHDPVAKLAQIGQVRLNRHVQPDSDAGAARMAVAEEIARQRAFIGRQQELREAEEELSGVADEGLTWRLRQANEAAEAALRPVRDDAETTEDGEKEMRDALQSYIDRQIWLKKKK
ncbi:DNA primase [Halovulum sp. GXIMD14793]